MPPRLALHRQPLPAAVAASSVTTQVVSPLNGTSVASAGAAKQTTNAAPENGMSRFALGAALFGCIVVFRGMSSLKKGTHVVTF